MTALDVARVPPRRSQPGRGAALLIVPVLVGAVVLVGLWQWRSPNAFYDQGSEVATYSQVGTTVLFGVATPRRDLNPARLTLHSIEPQIAEGEAEVDVLVCRPKPGAGGIGAVRGARALSRFCQAHGAAEDMQLVPGDDLILRVRSNEPGRVVVEGIRVTYAHGWRRGTQLTGVTARATFGTETVREHLDEG